MAPRNQLTRKEAQVATLVWQGLTNKEVALTIHTSEQVVKNYLRSIFDKIGVWSRLELAMYVAQHGGDNWLLESPHAPLAAILPAALPSQLTNGGVAELPTLAEEAARSRAAGV